MIVRAGQLRRDSTLRQAFEKMTNGVSVECYSDERAALERLLDSEAQSAGIAIAPDARTALVALLGADRETTRGEIAKLMLYALRKSRMRLEDLEAIVSGAAPWELEQVIDRSLAGDLREAAATAAQFFNEDGEGERLMARLIAQLMLLHRLRLEMDRSQPVDAARLPSITRLPPSARRAAFQTVREMDLRSDCAPAAGHPGRRRQRARAARLGPAVGDRMLWALAQSAAARGIDVVKGWNERGRSWRVNWRRPAALGVRIRRLAPA